MGVGQRFSAAYACSFRSCRSSASSGFDYRVSIKANAKSEGNGGFVILLPMCQQSMHY